MAKKGAKVTRIEFNYAAFDRARLSPNVAADIFRRATDIATAAGDGMMVKTGSNSSRVWALVYTGTREAMEAEAEDKALTMAIDAGRG